LAGHDIVAIGASSGGFSALRRFVARLPPEFPASLLVVVHLRSDIRSTLAEILGRSGPLPADFAEHGQILETGRIYVAPPNHHLLIDGRRIILGVGPWENNARPAIDALFRSAALCCGPRAIGIVLTGYLNDGSSGLQAIKRCGGIAVVQDPADADYPDMPQNALDRVAADHVVRLAELPDLLRRLVLEPAGPHQETPADLRLEVEIAAGGRTDMDQAEKLGKRSLFACPDCHGVMWEIEDGDLIRYRCHVGHAYTAHSFGLALQDNLVRALGSALRALEERAQLVRRLAEQARTQNRTSLARQWDEKAGELEAHADVVRRTFQDLERVGIEDKAAS
jgi:two-component system chemotaxis response regulator CheB